MDWMFHCGDNPFLFNDFSVFPTFSKIKIFCSFHQLEKVPLKTKIIIALFSTFNQLQETYNSDLRIKFLFSSTIIEFDYSV